jgi:hypothetical protein
MTLPVPAYISTAQIVTNSVRYRWDEWNVNDYFLGLDKDQFERLDALSDAANLALAIGCGEWICHRFATLSNDPDPQHFVEAAWAAIIHPAYCMDVETNDDEWRGPIRGPLNLVISILHDGIHRRDTDPHEATRACWMYNLAQHVLPRTNEFEEWFEVCVLRLQTHHPRLEEDDPWEEGPPFGTPVPREALDPSVPYDPKDAPGLLDRFLRGLDPTQNPFLAERDDVFEAPGFRGMPYRFDVERDRRDRNDY